MARSVLARSLLAIAFGLAVAGAAIAGCEEERPPVEAPDAGDGAGGAALPDGGAEDAADSGDAAPPDAADAGVAPVIVAITPTPRVAGDGDPTAGELLDAELITFAAGVRGVAVTRSLAEVEPGAAAELDALAQRYAAGGKQVLFNLALVDRSADGRPVALSSLPWDDPQVSDAIHGAVDLVLSSFGDGLAYLTFGRDVDVYLVQSPGDRAGFEAAALDACAYVAAHPGAPAGLRVGVGFSLSGAAAPDMSYPVLLEAGQIAPFSYLPGLSDGQAAPTSEIAGALDQMAALAGGRPVVLTGIGYPSATAAGSSEDKQRLFFATLRDTLAPRRASFPFVNVVELHDPWPAACADRAVSQGEPPDGPYAAYICSLGLFDVAASERPAWAEVSAFAAAFASP